MSELANDNLGSLGPVATQIREGLVFGRSNGDAFIPSNVRARALTAWRKASEAEAKRAEAEEREPNLLQPIGLHECRHTYASFCIAVGVNAKALTEYMGHSSITVSFDLYGHLMPGNEAEAAGLLDGYLDRATKLSAVFGKGERKHDRILHVRPGGGETAGLIRRIRDDVLRTSTIEVVSGGKWVDDPDSLKYFEASEAINSTSYPLPRTKPTRKHFRSACPYNFGS